MFLAALLSCLPALAFAGEPSKKEAQRPGPMEAFERLIGDEWEVRAQSGEKMFHTWRPGPGHYSVRRMTDGNGAGGDPWREVQVYYWHPARKEVRLLGISPFDGGISEGTMNFAKENAEGLVDLRQTGGLRKMGLKWAFDGRDKYRETLLEATRGGTLSPLVEFEHSRTKPPATPRPYLVEGQKPSERLNAFVPLLGHPWEASGEWIGGGRVTTRTEFLWVPMADAIYVRVTGGTGEHLLDAYVYFHTGAKTLRCLALTFTGGVHEGDVSAPKDGSVRFTLKGQEGEHAVRFDFEKDAVLRQRVWAVNGSERSLQLDLRHRKSERLKK